MSNRNDNCQQIENVRQYRARHLTEIDNKLTMYVMTVLDNRLCLSKPRKKVVKLTDLLDMTTVVDWDVKPHKIQTNYIL